MSNYVFENINEEDCKKILSLLKSNFPNISDRSTPHCMKSFQLSYGSNRITFDYYNSTKLMIQGNCFELEGCIEKINSKLNLFPSNNKKEEKRQQITLGESRIDAKSFVGFDESGKGECMGPIILGAVKFEKKKLNFLKSRLGKKDIKKLSWEEIVKLYNSLVENFEYKIRRINSRDIDNKNINTLLDEGYSKLISKISKSPKEEAFFIDNYGVSWELNEKLNKLKLEGAKIILAEKVDVNYVAGALASLVARKNRNAEMVILSKENILPGDVGDIIKFKSGAVNEETEKYLERYRKLFPYSDLPDFVRKSWANIKRFEEKNPKKEFNLTYKCNGCGYESRIVCLEIKQGFNESEFFCSSCGQLIKKEEINGMIRKRPIIVDTSTILSRTITKDLNSGSYFEGCSFVLPSSIYEEIDTKQPYLKVGGTREIDELKKLSNEKVINFNYHESEDHSDIPIDKKLIRVVRSQGGIMLTKDSNLASFSLMGAFVIRVIEYGHKEFYLKHVKKNI